MTGPTAMSWMDLFFSSRLGYGARGQLKTVAASAREVRGNPRWEHVGDDVDALLLGPTTDEDEELCVGVLLDVGPLLRLTLELRTLGLGLAVDLDALDVDVVLLERRDVVGVGVRQRVDAAQTGGMSQRDGGKAAGRRCSRLERPERRIPSPGSLAVLVRHSGDSLNVKSGQVARGG